MLHYLQRFLHGEPLTSLSILDLGTGLADIPRAIVAWARRRQFPVSITAVDRNPHVLRLAAEACRDWPEIRLERHDLQALSYAAQSFDLVLCSLALHHLGSEDAVALLRRMREITNRGCIVNDLRRNWLAIWSVDLLARTMRSGPIFRKDALQSVRAAFTVEELRVMAQEAGWNDSQVKRHHGVFRMVLEGRK